MAFTSFRFIVFLVLAAAAYFLTPKLCRWVTLFVANYVFYFISGGRIFMTRRPNLSELKHRKARLTGESIYGLSLQNMSSWFIIITITVVEPLM